MYINKCQLEEASVGQNHLQLRFFPTMLGSGTILTGSSWLGNQLDAVKIVPENTGVFWRAEYWQDWLKDFLASDYPQRELKTADLHVMAPQTDWFVILVWIPKNNDKSVYVKNSYLTPISFCPQLICIDNKQRYAVMFTRYQVWYLYS